MGLKKPTYFWYNLYNIINEMKWKYKIFTNSTICKSLIFETIVHNERFQSQFVKRLKIEKNINKNYTLRKNKLYEKQIYF